MDLGNNSWSCSEDKQFNRPVGKTIISMYVTQLEKEMATHSVFLPGESQGWRSLVGCRLWGRTESDTTDAT